MSTDRGSVDGVECLVHSFEAGGFTHPELSVYEKDGKVLHADEIAYGTWYDVDPESASEVLRAWRGDGRD